MAVAMMSGGDEDGDHNDDCDDEYGRGQPPCHCCCCDYVQIRATYAFMMAAIVMIVRTSLSVSHDVETGGPFASYQYLANRTIMTS